jgi:hypothetical protein
MKTLITMIALTGLALTSVHADDNDDEAAAYWAQSNANFQHEQEVARLEKELQQHCGRKH